MVGRSLASLIGVSQARRLATLREIDATLARIGGGREARLIASPLGGHGRRYRIRVRDQGMQHEITRRFDAVMDGSIQGVLIHTGGIIVYANRVLADMLGRAGAQDFLGRPYHDVVWREDKALVRGHVEARLAGRDAPTAYRFRLRRVDETPLWVNCRGMRTTWNGKPAVIGVFTDVSAEMRAAAELRGSEAMLGIMFAGTRDIVFLIDRNGTVIQSTPAIEWILGFKPDQIIGRHASDLIHPDDRERVTGAVLPALLKGRASAPLELRARTSQGTWRWVEAVGTSTRDPSGRWLGIVTAHDVDERKRFEAARSQSEQLLRHAIDSFNQPFTLWDQDDRLLLFNEALLRLHTPVRRYVTVGMTVADYAGLMWDHKLIRDMGGDRDAYLRLRIEQHRTLNTPILRQTADGRWLEVIARRTAEGYTIVVALDITELKDREIALAKARQQLVDAIEAMADGFALLGPDGRLAIHNRRFLASTPWHGDSDLTGMSFEEVLRRGIGRGPVDLRDAADPEAWIASRVRRHGEIGPPFEQEYDDGRWVLVSERRTAEGGTVVVRTDITALKQAEADLRVAKERAEAANLAKSQFLTGMSHELRTPLNAIIGFAQMLDGEFFGPLNSKQREYVNDVISQGGHLLALVSDILDMAKVEAGRYDVDLRNIRVAEAVAASLATVRIAAAEGGVAIRDRVKAGDVVARADDRAYRQILINLLSNAVKYTPRGGRIELDCLMKDGLVGVIVADDGIGISSEDVARLGRPFERVGDARTRRHPGTGLGLALSRGLAEMMGGRLDIESEIGRGTRATVWLPLVRSPSPD